MAKQEINRIKKEFNILHKPISLCRYDDRILDLTDGAVRLELCKIAFVGALPVGLVYYHIVNGVHYPKYLTDDLPGATTIYFWNKSKTCIMIFREPNVWRGKNLSLINLTDKGKCGKILNVKIIANWEEFVEMANS